LFSFKNIAGTLVTSFKTILTIARKKDMLFFFWNSGTEKEEESRGACLVEILIDGYTCKKRKRNEYSF
jgi:hypothetical protein